MSPPESPDTCQPSCRSRNCRAVCKRLAEAKAAVGGAYLGHTRARPRSARPAVGEHSLTTGLQFCVNCQRANQPARTQHACSRAAIDRERAIEHEARQRRSVGATHPHTPCVGYRRGPPLWPKPQARPTDGGPNRCLRPTPHVPKPRSHGRTLAVGSVGASLPPSAEAPAADGPPTWYGSPQWVRSA